WTEVEEAALIDYVSANHAKGGDGMHFDPTFWTAAVTEMASHFSGKGKAPDISACKSKWGRLRSMYDAVDAVGNASGMSYIAEHGAGITAEGESVWADLIKVC
ncbi:hypothetical protein M405DRAFT_746003, partial [Rhizopogon salebrosus TDB-379]